MDDHDNNGVGSMKEFIEFLVKHLFNKPEDVQVREVEGERFVIYELRVDKSDLGKVLGKKGQTAQAIHWILNAVSAIGIKSLILISLHQARPFRPAYVSAN